MPIASQSPILEPLVIVCDHSKDDADLLMGILRAFSNTTARVFVRDHATSSETVVALLPTSGPSLAAALRDWVIDWWSDDDTEEYGSPAAYLRGFGITLPDTEDGTFSTSCPFCGAEDALFVAGGTFHAMGMRLEANGFAFAEAQNVQTEDVQITCEACGQMFSADEILL
jgi:hypothetical protein